MYYKSDIHESLYKKILQQLSLTKPNTEYEAFAYLAASTEKTDLVQAFSSYEVDTEIIYDLSLKWSESEKYMLEIGFQLFNGSNLFYDEVDGQTDHYGDPVYNAKYPTWGKMLSSMDKENITVVLSAIDFRYTGR
ncbi:hypothetical protein [Terribacillus saccharophilus]|uniref:hypothetical protein n=1 Tax=Terribacillus saccharophilus TaxID=361277 RepID=UPI003D2DD356